MKLVLLALVLLSSAVSSNCEVVTIIYYENECKILNKLIMQSLLSRCIHTAPARFFNCKNVTVTPVQEFVDVEYFFPTVQGYYIHVN
jgi:hypothetical protein